MKGSAAIFDITRHLAILMPSPCGIRAECDMNHGTIMRYLPILLLLLLPGCFTSFRNSVTTTLRPEGDPGARLFSVVREIAREHELLHDSAASVPGKTMNFWGRPYHYYTFRIDTTDHGLVAGFVHEARMGSATVRRSEPEKAFLDALNGSLKGDVIEIDHHIDE